MYNSGRDTWAPEFRARRPDVSLETVETYLHNLYRVQPDFVYSVSRDFVRACQTPMLVMPDDTPAHPYLVSRDIAALAPKAEVTVYPWRAPKTCSPKRSPRCVLPAGTSTCDRQPLRRVVRRRLTAIVPTWLEDGVAHPPDIPLSMAMGRGCRGSFSVTPSALRTDKPGVTQPQRTRRGFIA